MKNFSSSYLLKYFGQVAEAPDAIPRLRRFILDLAVRGKLVEQNLHDEPASELLNRIETEKDRLVKADALRNQSTQLIDKEQTPFNIPTNWSWTQLSQIGIINPRNESTDSADASFVPMPMIFAEYGMAHQHEVRPWGEIKKGFTHFAEGDVGLAKITPCFENGKSTVFRNLTGSLGAGTTELHIVRPIYVVPDYILIFLKSSHFIETGIPKMTGTAGQKRVSKDYFAFSPFPLPPLAEQHRIVEKVDELMALFDELEKAQTKRESRRDRLVSATLHGLNNGDVNSEHDTGISFAGSARFYFNHLPRLITRPEHIQQLRQTILNLAVRGKLVPQNPNDKPATKLLGEIAIQREKLLKSGDPSDIEAKTQLRKQLQQKVQSEPYILPNCWQWATLMQCSHLVVDCHNKTAPYVKSGIPLLRTTNIRNGKLVLDDLRFVSDATFFRWSARCKPLAGDILITREAPMGEVARIPEGLTICMGQRMMLIRIIQKTIDPNYLIYCLRDPALMDRVQDKPVGATVQHLRVGGVETLLVPVPPLAEQKRIVARVDELMSLCDELESQLKSTTVTRRRLLEATLHEAIGGAY
jgi:type I restriction enzyme S subunit